MSAPCRSLCPLCAPCVLASRREGRAGGTIHLDLLSWQLLKREAEQTRGINSLPLTTSRTMAEFNQLLDMLSINRFKQLTGQIVYNYPLVQRSLERFLCSHDNAGDSVCLSTCVTGDICFLICIYDMTIWCIVEEIIRLRQNVDIKCTSGGTGW